jgi:hypothetical protein
MFRGVLGADEMEQIRHAGNAGYALGDERFRKEITLALGRRAGPGKPGRPPKNGNRGKPGTDHGFCVLKLPHLEQ